MGLRKMQPNPQTLIDLPGAGNAEKALRMAGLWELTPIEMLWQIPKEDCSPRTNSILWKMEDELMSLEAHK
jgi:hypothetical protein